MQKAVLRFLNYFGRLPMQKQDALARIAKGVAKFQTEIFPGAARNV